MKLAALESFAVPDFRFSADSLVALCDESDDFFAESELLLHPAPVDANIPESYAQ